MSWALSFATTNAFPAYCGEHQLSPCLYGSSFSEWVISWKRSANQTHTHTHTRIGSSFATWAMILFGGCLFFSKSPSSHSLPLAKNRSSLLHTLYSQPCFPAFPSLSSTYPSSQLPGTPISPSPLHPQLEILLFSTLPQLPRRWGSLPLSCWFLAALQLPP